MGLGFKHLFTRNQKPKERRLQPRFMPAPGTTVLLIDDSRTVLHSLKTTLQQGGYTVLTAPDGESGIEKAASCKPDLILLDIVMPGMNGYKVTRMIRKNEATSQIPIVLISGTDQPTERFWGIKMGANDFIAKPISRGSLFGAVEKCMQAVAA